MRHEFPMSIYKARILFICDHKEWVANVKHYECPQQPDPLDAWAAVVRLPLKHGMVLMVRARVKDIRAEGALECADVAAHEATHLMRHICENAGEIFLGWEAEAHLVGGLTRWLFSILWTGKPAPF